MIASILMHAGMMHATVVIILKAQVMGGTTGLRACIKGLVMTTNGFGPRRPCRVIPMLHGT